MTPEQLGLTRAPREAVLARDLDHAAQLVRSVLEGKERGPARDMTLLSAAAALLVSEQTDSLSAGVQLAAQAIDDGKAAAKLAAWADCSRGRS